MGYISGTKSKDGQQVDFLLGPHPHSQIVFVADTTHDGGKFRQSKVLVGFHDIARAKDAYRDTFDHPLRSVTPMTVGQIRAWLARGDTTKPVAGQVSRYSLLTSLLNERYAAQRGLFDEESHPRETMAHEGKRPGEFAAKGSTSEGWTDEKKQAWRKVQIAENQPSEDRFLYEEWQGYPEYNKAINDSPRLTALSKVVDKQSEKWFATQDEDDDTEMPDTPELIALNREVVKAIEASGGEVMKHVKRHLGMPTEKPSHPVTSALDEAFSLKRESATRFVPKNQTGQQADLFGETKLTHSPADVAVKKQSESLPGQGDLLASGQPTKREMQQAKEYSRIFKLTPKQSREMVASGIELSGWKPRQAGEPSRLIGRHNGKEVVGTVDELLETQVTRHSLAAAFNACMVERYGQLGFKFREEDHPRESAAHDTKRPGEFAKKDEPAVAAKPKWFAKGNDVHETETGARRGAFRSSETAANVAKMWNERDMSKVEEPVETPKIPEPVAEKPAEVKAAEHPITAAINEAVPAATQDASSGVLPGLEPEKPSETPREASARQQKALDADYEFARKSSVSNAGADLKGSARHKRNAWRGLAEAESDGTAADLVTRDNLLKSEPHELMEHVDTNPVTSLMGHYALRAFPPKPGYGTERRRKNTPEAEKVKDRKQFLDAYREYKTKVESLAATEPNTAKAMGELQSFVMSKISELRATRVAGQPDRYNNTANSLASTYNDLNSRNRRPSSVTGRVSQFMGLAKAKYETPEKIAENIHEHVNNVIEGQAPVDSFGQKREGKAATGFNAADAYVKHATRKGGRDVSDVTQDANKAAAHLLSKFGARGVQFGNSVTDDERVHHAAKLVESLADLADVTGFKPEDIGLGGKIGWAIGARGHGTASAHYEPTTQVINLTRKNGVGALAHEWGHGFDNSLKGFGSNNYVSEASRSSRRMRKEVAEGKIKIHDQAGFDRMYPPTSNKVDEAMADVMDGMESSGYQSRLRTVLRKMVGQKLISQKKASDYWDSGRERFARSFERHVQYSLRADGRDNTYLTGLGDTGEESLWPTDAEAKAMAPAFDAMLAAYRQHKYGSEEKQKYSRSQLVAAFNGMLVDRYELAPQVFKHIAHTIHGGRAAGWDKSKHPRGQPENAGEFSKGSGTPAATQPRFNVDPKQLAAAKAKIVPPTAGTPATAPPVAIKPGTGFNLDPAMAAKAWSKFLAQGTKGKPALPKPQPPPIEKLSPIPEHLKPTVSQPAPKPLGKRQLAVHEVAKAAAEKHGVSHSDVMLMMRDIHNQRLDEHARTEAIRKQWTASHPRWNAARIRRHEGDHDYDSIPGYDTTVEQMAGHVTGLAGENRLLTSSDPHGELWNIIHAGATRRPALADEDIADEAARYVADNSQQFNTPHHNLRRGLDAAFETAMVPADDPTKGFFSLRSSMVREFYGRFANQG